mmetsp:Transcript_8777/g.13006  ORF Transcript_8777/g.13006 Transcript_8777/m.13006 type:complete len:444 (-) Transcript_8777:822-2153(-)
MKVIILSGFLGSGKTTLLKHLLTNNNSKKIGVIVNDMAALNLDAELVRNVVQQEEKMIQLENGCVCCTLREDLYEALRQMKEEQKMEYVIIETTGISEPMNVAETFYIDYKDTRLVDEGIKIAHCVTVVDVTQVFQHLTNDMLARETDPSSQSPYEGTLAQLFIDQLEFANTILLNKLDLWGNDETKRKEIMAMVKALNPSARVIETTRSAVKPELLLNADIFDLEKAQLMPGWLQILENGKYSREKEEKLLKSEIDEYNISSFIYKADRPFDGVKLEKWLDSNYLTTLKESNIIRSKGFFWMAHQPDYRYHWEQAGKTFSVEVEGLFFAAIPEKDREEQFPPELIARVKEEIKNNPQFGDRRQEIVFIGFHQMNKDKIIGDLNSCLVDDDVWGNLKKMDLDKWGTFLFPDNLEEAPFTIQFEEEEDQMEDDGEMVAEDKMQD